jgi:hypothetical protein
MFFILRRHCIEPTISASHPHKLVLGKRRRKEGRKERSRREIEEKKENAVDQHPLSDGIKNLAAMANE